MVVCRNTLTIKQTRLSMESMCKLNSLLVKTIAVCSISLMVFPRYLHGKKRLALTLFKLLRTFWKSRGVIKRSISTMYPFANGFAVWQVACLLVVHQSEVVGHCSLLSHSSHTLKQHCFSYLKQGKS